MPTRLPRPRVEYWQSTADGLWYFHKVNRNGRITEPSQGYAHRRSARGAARRDVAGVAEGLVPLVLVVDA